MLGKSLAWTISAFKFALLIKARKAVHQRSPVAVRFRQWANDKLKEYIVKGFVLDDARLKNPGKGRALI